MTKRVVVGIVFLLASLHVTSLWADQFSANIEAKLKSGKSGESKAESSQKTTSERSEEDDGFLSEEKQKIVEKNVPMWLAIGPQLGLGPNILLPFGDATEIGTTGVAPFENGGGGIGGGGGGLLSARWLQGKFGVDLGIFAERNQIRTNMTINGFEDNIFIYKYSLVRVPLLAKLYKLKENQRWSLGLGPELVVGLDSTTGQIRSDEVIQTVLRVKREIDLLGAFNMGWGVKYKKWLVGVDLKISYNITSAREYDKKVTPASGGFQVIGAHALDARILLGLMYEISLWAN